MEIISFINRKVKEKRWMLQTFLFAIICSCVSGLQMFAEAGLLCGFIAILQACFLERCGLLPIMVNLSGHNG
jgi:hypothetical protein